MASGSQPQAEAEAEAEEPRPWVLLAAVPRVLAAPRLPCLPLVGKRVKDVALSLVMPPRISVLRAGRHIIPRNDNTVPKYHHPLLSDPAPSSRRYPYIAAVDPSGAMILCASHRADRDQVPYLNWPRFFVCDVVRGTALELPEVEHVVYALDHPGRVGLLRDAGGRLVVAELQTVPLGDLADDANFATLLRHVVGTEKWVMTHMRRPERDTDYAWGYHGVVAHGGRLWWIDLSYGLLSCDPFVEKPHLTYTALPPVCPPPDATTSRVLNLIELDKHCCVRSSGGSLRFLTILKDGVVTTLRMWTLNDAYKWVPDYAVPISAIFADEQLLHEVPVLGAIHPFDPNILYMWLGTRIFSIDVSAKKVIQCGDPCVLPDHEIPVPEGEFPSSRYLHAWQLPPELHGDLHGADGRCLSFLGGALSIFQPAEEPEQH